MLIKSNIQVDALVRPSRRFVGPTAGGAGSPLPAAIGLPPAARQNLKSGPVRRLASFEMKPLAAHGIGANGELL